MSCLWQRLTMATRGERPGPRSPRPEGSTRCLEGASTTEASPAGIMRGVSRRLLRYALPRSGAGRTPGGVGLALDRPLDRLLWGVWAILERLEGPQTSGAS